MLMCNYDVYCFVLIGPLMHRVERDSDARGRGDVRRGVSGGGEGVAAA